VQEKTALLRHVGRWLKPHGATPTTHILKLPLGLVGNKRTDWTTPSKNEWLCLELLRAFGLLVARSEIITFGEPKVLCVERFDRRAHSSGGWIMRLAQEDFCQVFGRPSHLKHEAGGGPGVPDIASVLRQWERAALDWACCSPPRSCSCCSPRGTDTRRTSASICCRAAASR
jgi:serine/threonine-protein kinase HipA